MQSHNGPFLNWITISVARDTIDTMIESYWTLLYENSTILVARDTIDTRIKSKWTITQLNYPILVARDTRDTRRDTILSKSMY